MNSASRPKRMRKPPKKFVPLEEGDPPLMSQRKKKSRSKGVKKSREKELEEKRKYMSIYREKQKKKGTDEPSLKSLKVEETKSPKK